MNESIFKRDTLAPFLAFSSEGGSLSLHAVTVDEHFYFNLKDVFKTCPALEQTVNHPSHLLVFCNQLSNQVARSARRGVANFLFIHPETNQERLRQLELTPIRFNLTVIEDETIPKDEMRMMHHSNGELMVDGPFQIVGKKLYCNPNYRSYFVRGKINANY